MPRRILDRVTVTGADDSVNIADMIALSEQYPFLEWGILLSKSSQGSPRFPSQNWLAALADIIGDPNYFAITNGLRFCAHLCGEWVREACAGTWNCADEVGSVWGIFRRVQLNFHAYIHMIDDDKFFRRLPSRRQIIFQVDGINDCLASNAHDEGADAVPLYDLSGGAGVLPDNWPIGLTGIYCGYAGGLSPENVGEQLVGIERVCGEGPIWIDAETHLRSRDNTRLDLDRVEAFLEIAKAWVIE